MLSQPERQGAFEWHGFMYAAAMLAYGFLAYALAFANTPEGGLLVHSYYNADWFKHMGHVHALAAHGIPARDIFGGGEALHYYWLSYILPGAGTAIGGDGWASLFTANAVFVTLFSLLFYGVIRRVADSPRVALFVVFLGTLVSAPLIYAIRTVSGEALQTMVRFADAPAPALLILPQVIPQHTLVLALLLGWAVTVGRSKPENEEENRATWLLIRLGLASTLAISTLLGAMALAAYGLTTLWQHRAKAIAEVAVMALLSGMIVLALGVLQFGNPDSALESPLFQNINQLPWYLEPFDGAAKLIGVVGLPFFAALYVLRYWRGEEMQFARRLALCLAGAAFAGVMLSKALLPPRVSIEILIRARLLLSIAIALVGAWAMVSALKATQKTKRVAVIVLIMLVLAALPAAIVRTVWLADFGGRAETEVPPDDLRVLAHLREKSEPSAIVWQYPEPPHPANPSGEDAWVPIFAGRTVLRLTTRYRLQHDRPLYRAVGTVFCWRGRARARPSKLGIPVAQPAS